MLKENQYIKVKWQPPNKTHYMSKGYSFTSIGDTLLVKAEDLMPSSREKVTVICDYCGREFEMYMLKEYYGDDNCCPQYNFSKCAFDCLLTVGGIQIDVEYDGKYWHKNKEDRDMRRDFYVMRRGIKVLRFVGDINPPTEEQIKQGVDYLVNSEHHHLIINI